MNCKVLQKQLLGLETPDRPPPEAAAHLACCPDCREWHGRLVHMERAVACLPLPSADAARIGFLNRLTCGEKPQPKTFKTPLPSQPKRRSIAGIVGLWILDLRESPRRLAGAGLVVGMAASLLLFVMGWMIYSHSRGNHFPEQVVQSPIDTLREDLSLQDVKLAEGTTPRERVEAMADAADKLLDHIRQQASVANNATKMETLAKLYKRVVAMASSRLPTRFLLRNSRRFLRGWPAAWKEIGAWRIGWPR